MLAFTALLLAAIAPLLVPAAYVGGTDATAREVASTRHLSAALEYFEPNTTALEKRTPIQDCSKVGDGEFTCFSIAGDIRAIGSSIASFVKGRSDAQDCSVHTGSIDDVQWRYYTASTNGKCNTTAVLATIRGAIDAFLEEHVNGWCSNVCLRMTHGEGAWTGYLSLSPVGSPSPPDCGTDNYASCESDGEDEDLGARSV